MPGHTPDRFHALLPLLAALAVLHPPALEALATAVGMVAAIRQLH